ncbi:hypothetical protein JCM14467A_12560 [Vulcanisaeta sp. JCM 14467]
MRIIEHGNYEIDYVTVIEIARIEKVNDRATNVIPSPINSRLNPRVNSHKINHL